MWKSGDVFGGSRKIMESKDTKENDMLVKPKIQIAPPQ